MKKYALVMVLVFIVSSFVSGTIFAEEPAATPPDQVIIYCFCTDFCCPGCVNIKKWTAQVVEADFKDYSASGKLAIKEINIFTKGNEHFMNDYEICTNAIVLSLVKGGKEIKFTNLARIWCYVCCQEKFKPYIKDSISKYVQEL